MGLDRQRPRTAADANGRAGPSHGAGPSRPGLDTVRLLSADGPTRPGPRVSGNRGPGARRRQLSHRHRARSTGARRRQGKGTASTPLAASPTCWRDASPLRQPSARQAGGLREGPPPLGQGLLPYIPSVLQVEPHSCRSARPVATLLIPTPSFSGPPPGPESYGRSGAGGTRATRQCVSRPGHAGLPQLPAPPSVPAADRANCDGSDTPGFRRHDRACPAPSAGPSVSPVGRTRADSSTAQPRDAGACRALGVSSSGAAGRCRSRPGDSLP